MFSPLMREILHAWRDFFSFMWEILHACRESGRNSVQAGDSLSMRESWKPWSGIVCFQSFVASKYLWTIFMTGQRQSFSERTFFWRNTTLDATVLGKIWNALILVDNNDVFVLQATISINSPNLEASRLQIHFLQHVKLHVFGEDVFWRNTDF